MTAPVLLVFLSRDAGAGERGVADDVAAVVEGQEGRYSRGSSTSTPRRDRAGHADPADPARARRARRPADDPPSPARCRARSCTTLFAQLGQQLTTQGITGRHQPRSAAPAAGEGEEPQVDPRYAAAQDALGEGDIERAVAEYQKLVDANPADSEAAAGLAMAKVLQRTQGADLHAARAAAADAPDDVDAQTLVADLDLLGGHVEDAFNRLVALVARTSDADRTRARDHLLGLFAAVGNDDERVLAGRRNLASALF